MTTAASTLLARVLTATLCLATAQETLAASPLTDVPGDPARGREIYQDMERGHCALCHPLPGSNIAFEGNIGPSLANVGDRLDAAQLRARLIDPTVQNPETVMPAYFRTEGLIQVQRQYQGQTILTAQEIEDLVSFLRQQQAQDDHDR
mgnify:CR=1 FL=1